VETQSHWVVAMLATAASSALLLVARLFFSPLSFSCLRKATLILLLDSFPSTPVLSRDLWGLGPPGSALKLDGEEVGVGETRNPGFGRRSTGELTSPEACAVKETRDGGLCEDNKPTQVQNGDEGAMDGERNLGRRLDDPFQLFLFLCGLGFCLARVCFSKAWKEELS